MVLRIAGVVKESVVDGPGLRFVIFTQGCPHHCIGCHNPETHDFNDGKIVTIIDLLNSIKNVKLISGVTFSGGEPFAQAGACAHLARLIKKIKTGQSTKLNIVTYTGYYHAELLNLSKSNSEIAELLRETDILIDGPFDATQKNPNLPFRGSNNQNIIINKPTPRTITCEHLSEK